MNKFRHYLKTNGNEKSAELFGVSTHTIRSWRFDGKRPRINTANRIVAVTRGKVKLSDIYGIDQ